ncbi:FAD-dependent oxidoreductase [Bacillus sp. FSL W7-1360]
MVVGEMVQERELIIIGGGPGGYHAAIRAAQLGLEVTLIEKEQLGGVCLNKGCIPSKIYAHAAHMWQKAQQQTHLGIPAPQEPYQFANLAAHRETVMTRLREGVSQLCQAQKIEVVTGEASFLAEDRVGVTNGHQFDVYRFKQAIIATGQRPDNVTEALADVAFTAHTLFMQKEVPSSLIVIGQDVIALEAAFSYQALGSEVTLFVETPLSLEDSLEKELWRAAKKAGMRVVKDATIATLDAQSSGITLTYEKGGKHTTIEAARLYEADLWRANTDNLGLERLGITIDERGYIEVDQALKTSSPSIWAIGDVIQGAEHLATNAIKQATVVAGQIAKQPTEWDETFIPRVYRTIPPMATVGWTSAEATQAGREVVVSTTPFRSNGYATLSNANDGHCTLVKDADTDELLGMHVIGEGAAELITMGTLGLEMVARDEDIRFPLYPHPSYAEVVMETADGWLDQTIHQPPKKKRPKKQVTT